MAVNSGLQRLSTKNLFFVTKNGNVERDEIISHGIALNVLMSKELFHKAFFCDLSQGEFKDGELLEAPEDTVLYGITNKLDDNPSLWDLTITSQEYDNKIRTRLLTYEIAGRKMFDIFLTAINNNIWGYGEWRLEN